MDNFYNLSKYIGLKHIQKFRICRYWANEVYLSHRGKYDSINDPYQRQRYNWLYLKKSLSNASYIEDDNNMYYSDRKLKTIIKVIYMTDMLKDKIYRVTPIGITENTFYFIRSIKFTTRTHVIIVDTDNMYNMFKLANVLISSNIIDKLNKCGSLKAFNDLMRSIKNWKYNSDEVNMINRCKFISVIEDTRCPDYIFRRDRA